jgi:hypothetical protein
MSQIQSFVLSEGPGSGPVFTLTGDTGGAITPTNPGGNINIEGQVLPQVGFATVAGTPVNNTLNILPLLDEVTTNNNSITFFPHAYFDYTITSLTSFAIVFNASVVGYQTGFSNACGGFVSGVARKTTAGAVTMTGFDPLLSRDVGGVVFGIGVNGNQVGVFVQGLNAETWNWTCTFQYLVNLI